MSWLVLCRLFGRDGRLKRSAVIRFVNCTAWTTRGNILGHSHNMRLVILVTYGDTGQTFCAGIDSDRELPNIDTIVRAITDRFDRGAKLFGGPLSRGQRKRMAITPCLARLASV